MDSILQSGRGGGLIRETKLPMQELELKMQGGLIREGGVIAGFYGISISFAQFIPVYVGLAQARPKYLIRAVHSRLCGACSGSPQLYLCTI